MERGIYYLLVADIAGEGKAGWAQLINNNLINTVTIIEEDFGNPLHGYGEETIIRGGRFALQKDCFRDVVFGWERKPHTREGRKSHIECEQAKGDICFAKEGRKEVLYVMELIGGKYMLKEEGKKAAETMVRGFW